MTQSAYLIRHAHPETLGYFGFPGPSLGAYGRKQAQAISVYLKAQEINHVYLSDYRRVSETVNALRAIVPNIPYDYAPALRAREKRSERLASHVNRVRKWLDDKRSDLESDHVAIFAHCGTLNILQFYLENSTKQGWIPFEDELDRHTPIAGIWEVRFSNDTIHDRRLVFDGAIESQPQQSGETWP